MQIEDIIIDDEFRDLLPSLADRSRLESKIELEGWTDEPITVWLHHGILLDGHNRLAIYESQKERGIDVGEPQIKEMAFASREAAFHWVVNNQCARRNLTPEEQRYLLGRKYTAEKGVKGAPEGNQNASKKQSAENQHFVSAPSHKTAERIAREHSVGKDKVQKAEQYANAVDDLDKRGVVKKADILSGAVKVPASKVVAASKAATPEEAKAVLATKPSKKEKEAAPTSKTSATEGLRPPKEQRKMQFAIERAEDAITALKSIPDDDSGARKAGFKIVADWIKTNS